MVSDITTVGTALNQQAQTNGSSAQLAQDFNQFLILLTTQLQNQDPLSPMDTTEFTNQLVAFSGVEQQINANQKLDSLVSLQLGNSMGSALSYVGLEAKYLSSEFNFDGERPVEINYALDAETAETKIRILDEEGEIIFEADGSRETGSQEFVWDGKDENGDLVEAGTYEIRIDALDIEGEAVGSTTVVSGIVKGVETQGGLILLLIGDRAVSLGQVLNVNLPEALPPPPPPDGDGDGDGDGDDI